MLYSPSTNLFYNDSVGLDVTDLSYLTDTTEIPSDAFLVYNWDARQAIYLTPSEYSYSFNPPLTMGGFGVLSITPKNPSYFLSIMQANQCAIIEANYQIAKTKPVTYTSVGGITQTYPASDIAANYLQATLIGSSGQLSSDFFWQAEDKTPVPFTLTDVQNLAKLVYDQGLAAFAKAQLLKNQVSEVNNTGTVQEIINAVQSIAW